MVDGFVGKAGIKFGYRQGGAGVHGSPFAWRRLHHNLTNVKIPAAASTWDKNAQIDKPFYLY